MANSSSEENENHLLGVPMRTVHVRYTATFDATIEVPDDATIEGIGVALANLNIPEDKNSKYHYDSFEPETDENGDPQLYDEDGDPIE